ncbi:hypothetical protein C0585_04620 [Candidatus Woesearchaeota archaeon]|nr:MAG: hypothetical protein C0585_04620 [Candidatus Woesearchaeota archaeon]
MGLETLGESLQYLQYLLILSVPVFGVIYKETFLFFVPIVIFVIMGFGYVKKKIIEGASEEAITNLIFSIGKWSIFLWVLEFSIYLMIKFTFSMA